MDKGEIKPGFPYTRTALICGLLASLAFALTAPHIKLINFLDNSHWLISVLGRFGLFALPPLFLMLPGVLVKPPEMLAAKILLGITITSPLLHLAHVGGPPGAWPELNGDYGYIIVVGVALYYGAAILTGIQGRWHIRLFSPAVAIGLIALLTSFFQLFLPPEPFALFDRWEFATIIIGGPLLCVLTWLPFDLFNRKKPTADFE